MIFIPIGHDQTIRRFPWLTVAIMVVCALLQFHRAFFSPSENDLAQARAREDAAEQVILERVAREGVPDDEEAQSASPIALPPELTNATHTQILDAVRAGKVGDPNDPAILALRQTDAQLAAVRNRDLAQRFGYRPSHPWSINLVLCAFVHGGFLHLAGNLLFLWLCGCTLEDRWGRPAFAAFYLLSAIASSLLFARFHPGSDTPLVGASGAIAGAMGGFLVCFHAAQIKGWYYWRFRTGITFIPAYIALPFWFISQLAQSLLEVSGLDEVAYSAHIGGFVFGVFASLILRFSGAEKFLMLPPDDDDDAPAPAFALAHAPAPAPAPAPALASERPPSMRPPPVEFPTVPPPAPDDPLAELKTMLTGDPKNDDVRYELCLAAITVRDLETIEATATRVFVWLGEHSRWQDVLELQRSLDHANVDRPLSDRAYSMIVRAAFERGDAKMCVRIATKMQTAHPKSPLLPRAFWDVAHAQAAAGRADLSRKTLTQLVERFPSHRFAEEARRKLETVSVGTQ